MLRVLSPKISKLTLSLLPVRSSDAGRVLTMGSRVVVPLLAVLDEEAADAVDLADAVSR